MTLYPVEVKTVIEVDHIIYTPNWWYLDGYGGLYELIWCFDKWEIL